MTFRKTMVYVFLALAPTAMIAQQQPDRVLYESSLKDIQHHRLERARLTLQTLLNTYVTSEYRAPAMLAVADSWYREHNEHGWSQAEEECKSLISQFPDSSSAADARELLRKIEAARAGKGK